MHLWLLLFVLHYSSNASFVNSDSKPQACSNFCWNGYCVDGNCICRPGWTGIYCETCFGRMLFTDSFGWLTDGPYNYSHDQLCVWYLDGRAYQTSSITLTIQEMHTECLYDNLRIFVGDSAFKNLFAVLSGNFKPTSLSIPGSDALIVFQSDRLLNRSGLNISYAFDYCPMNCSNQGLCDSSSGKCECFGSWTGEDCSQPRCTQRCMYGICNSEHGMHCSCNRTQGDQVNYHGQYCDRRTSVPAVKILHDDFTDKFSFASSSGVILNSSLIIVGGYNLQGAIHNLISSYDLNAVDAHWEHVIVPFVVNNADNLLSPADRYDHSLVVRNGLLYIFGGINSKHKILNDFWELDLNNGPKWKRLSDAPFRLTSHSSFYIAKGDKMLVLFGFSPDIGYLENAIMYSFEQNNWEQNVTFDKSPSPPVVTGFATLFDSENSKIWIHGGILQRAAQGQLPSAQLYSLDLSSRIWTMHTPSPFPMSRHQLTLLPGSLFLATGGCMVNSDRCVNSQPLIYSSQCDLWIQFQWIYPLSSFIYPKSLKRCGHVALSYNRTVILSGGYNGQTLSDVVQILPALCKSITIKENCTNSRSMGAACKWSLNECLDADLKLDFDWKTLKTFQLAQNAELLSQEPSFCNDSIQRHDLMNSSEDRCYGLDYDWCSTLHECTWCRAMFTCIRKSDCPALQQQQSLASYGEYDRCNRHLSCFHCHLQRDCVWISKSIGAICKSVNISGENNSSLLAVGQCPPICDSFNSCVDCVANRCLWCTNLQKCMDVNSFLPMFSYGQCYHWTTRASKCGNCESATSCGECHARGEQCGWCDAEQDQNMSTGLGNCLQGTVKGPLNESLCPSSSQWHYFNCSACQCNGHATCYSNSSECLPCQHNTTGQNCQYCLRGYFGQPLNGGNCSKCQCYRQARDCDAATGQCFCFTKGVIGDRCDQCAPDKPNANGDANNRYIGDPKVNSCFYELKMDYVFTFTMNLRSDPNVTNVNFIAVPRSATNDINFRLECTSYARVNLSLYSPDWGLRSRPFFRATLCGSAKIDRRFDHSEYPLGDNASFVVQVYDFTVPIEFKIAFSYASDIDWMRFFITFASCFLLLLVLAALLWKLKLRVDVYRRRQRLFVQMAQMAARPFASVAVDLWSGTGPPSPLALEPLRNFKAGVTTVAVRLPTGRQPYAASGQPGLALACALTQLSAPHLTHLHAPSSDQIDLKPRQRRRPACLS